MLLLLAVLSVAGPGPRADVAFSLGASQLDDGRAIAIDGDGNTYVTGRFRLTVDFDPGPGVFELTSASGFARYVASYQAGGALRYAFKIDGATQGLGEAGIAVDASGNVYVTSRFTGVIDFDPGPDQALLSAVDGRIFVASYDGNANYRYAFNMGVNSGLVEGGAAIAVDASGNSYVTGAFAGETDFDPSSGELLIQANGFTDSFVASYTPNGNLRFAFGVGGSLSDEGLGITIDGSGNSYVSGLFRDSVDFDPGTGQFILASSGDEDAFLASYTDSGALRYALSVGGPGPDRGNAVGVDGAGNGFLVGRFTGTADFDPGAGELLITSNGDVDFYVASYDAAGGLRFAHGFGNTNPDQAFAATVDVAGNVYVSGDFRDTVDFDPGPANQSISVLGTSAFVASYTNAGEYRTAYAFTRIGTGSSTGRGVAVNGAGRPHVIGNFTGTVDFDPGPGTAPLTSAGSDDMFFSDFFPGVLGPGGIASASLRVTRSVDPNVILEWSASCSFAEVDYGIYEGQIGIWYDHTADTCVDQSGDLREEITPAPGNRYFLVVPNTATEEGSYGVDSDGVQRPQGFAACRAVQVAETCP